MPDQPVQESLEVVVAAFKDMDSASHVLAELMQAKRRGLMDLEEGAVITKNAAGKSKIRETHDMGAGRGASIGAITGAVLRLIAFSLGWMTLGGGVIGGIADQLSDADFPQARLKRLVEGMKPGSSALIVVAAQKWVVALVDEIEKHDARLLRAELPQAIVQEVATAKRTVYTVATTGDAIFASNPIGISAGGQDELVMHDNSYATKDRS